MMMLKLPFSLRKATRRGLNAQRYYDRTIYTGDSIVHGLDPRTKILITLTYIIGLF